MGDYIPPAGAGTASNLVYCALGSVRSAADSLWQDNDRCEFWIEYAIKQLEEALEARRSELTRAKI